MTKDAILDLLSYKAPTPAKIELHERVNRAILDVGAELGEILGDSTLARDVFMRLSDVRMMANLAVSQMDI